MHSLSSRNGVVRKVGLLSLGALVLGCGGTATSTTDGPSGAGGAATTGGASSSSGGSSSGGSGDGGSGSGGLGSGGLSTGGFGTGGGAGAVTGSGGSGGVINGACNVRNVCVAVVDASDVCGCQYPFAASATDLANNPCLVPWEQRGVVPAGCAPDDPLCPEFVPCAPPPGPCVSSLCNQGTCELVVSERGEEGACEIPDDCQALAERRDSTLEAARACNLAMSSISCDASALVLDGCGCPQVVNERNPELVRAAQEASDAWWSSGCEPTPCPAVVCLTPTAGQCGSGSTCVAR